MSSLHAISCYRIFAKAEEPASPQMLCQSQEKRRPVTYHIFAKHRALFFIAQEWWLAITEANRTVKSLTQLLAYVRVPGDLGGEVKANSVI